MSKPYSLTVPEAPQPTKRKPRRIRALLFVPAILTLVLSLAAYLWPVDRDKLIRIAGPDGKIGLINTDGRIVLEPAFDEIGLFSGKAHAPASKDGKWGLIDRTGKVIVPPEWDDIGHFGTHDLARVGFRTNVSMTYGWVDKNGEVVISPKWKGADLHFDEYGTVTVEDESGYGRIDTKGRVVIPTKYAEMGTYDEQGMALANRGGKWGWINRKGEELIPCAFYLENQGNPFDPFRGPPTTPFPDRWGRIPQTLYRGFDSYGICPVWYDEKCGIISRAGKLITPQWDQVRPFDSKGMAAAKRGDKWGWINADGDCLIEYRWDDCLRFASDDLAAVQADGEWGWINRDGEVAIEPQWDPPKALQPESRSGLSGWGDLEWDFWDPFGTVPQWEDFEFDESGMARVCKDGLYGWINRKGNLVIPPNWDDTGSFDSMGMVAVEKSGKWGWIDRKGDIVIPVEHDSVGQFGGLGDESFAEVNVGDRYGWIDRRGQMVMQYKTLPKAIGTKFDSEGMLPILSEAGILWVNRKGDTVFEIQNNWTTAFDTNGLCISFSREIDDGDLAGTLLNRSGQTVIELPDDSWQWIDLGPPPPFYVPRVSFWEISTSLSSDEESKEPVYGYAASKANVQLPWFKWQLLRITGWINGKTEIPETQTACVVYDPTGNVIWDNRWVRFETWCLIAATLALVIGILTIPFDILRRNK